MNLPDVLSPFTHLVAAILAGAHKALSGAGLDPHAGLTWAASIAGLVLVVRILLLPLVAQGVRLSHQAAAARPEMAQLRAKYAGKRDPASLRAMAAEQRRIQSEHGMSALGCLPLLLQLPILFALYRVLSDVAGGLSVGAMDAALVASAGSASLFGVRLAERIGPDWLANPGEVAVIGGIALVAAALAYATQRWLVLPNTILTGLPETFVDAHKLMPIANGAGVLLAAAVVPAGLLLYWLVANVLTLAQQAVITTRFPTPHTAAYDERRRRLDRRGA